MTKLMSSFDGLRTEFELYGHQYLLPYALAVSLQFLSLHTCRTASILSGVYSSRQFQPAVVVSHRRCIFSTQDKWANVKKLSARSVCYWYVVHNVSSQCFCSKDFRYSSEARECGVLKMSQHFGDVA